MTVRYFLWLHKVTTDIDIMPAPSKIGRPKKPAKEVRKRVLRIRLSEIEYGELARSTDRDLSTWAREVLLRVAKRTN